MRQAPARCRPLLWGGEREVERFSRSEKSLIIHGLRGVGKTVLVRLVGATLAAYERGGAVRRTLRRTKGRWVRSRPSVRSSPRSCSSLVAAMHRMAQQQLPVGLVGAGLPTLPGLILEANPNNRSA